MMYLLLLFVALAAAGPTKNLVIDEKYFPDSSAIYTAEHDVVEISVPLNELNLPNDDEETDYDHLKYLFFIEADLKTDGTKDYKGAYVFKNGKAKKILENGQTVTYGKDYTVYVGASDGIYKYNYHNDYHTSERYGDVTDNVIRMGINTEDVSIYYLTSDYVLYKFDKDETTSSKIEAVKDARDFVIDFEGNLYFYDGANKVYVYDGSKVFEAEDLPVGSKVSLVNPPILVGEVYIVVDGNLYRISPNGRCSNERTKIEVPVTAFAPDTALIQYYAYNKNIYQFNLNSLFEKIKCDDFKEYFEDKEEDIKTIAKSKLKKKV